MLAGILAMLCMSFAHQRHLAEDLGLEPDLERLCLTVNLLDNREAEAGGWQSAMTSKLVGALRDLGNLPAYELKALGLGLGRGLAIELARKLLHRSERARRFVAPGSRGFAVGWILDAFPLSSPYASSSGGFVELPGSSGCSRSCDRGRAV